MSTVPQPVAAPPRQYGYFSALVLAFFSPDLYRDVARRWKGVGLLFLLFLVALNWVPICIKAQVSFRKFTGETIKVTSQIPDITIKDGRASTPEARPYELKDPDDGKVFAIVDTTGQYKTLDDTPAEVLLTETRFYMRQNTGRVETYELSQWGDRTITGPKVQHWIEVFGHFIAPIMFVFTVAFSWVYRAMQMLIYAAIVLAFAGSVRAKLTYGQCMRLAAVAVTPAMILDTVINWMLPTDIRFWWFICLLTSLIYLFIAAKVNAEAPQPQPLAQAAGPGI